MDKKLLEDILKFKQRKESFCLVSKAQSTDTHIVSLKGSSSSPLSSFIKKAIKDMAMKLCMYIQIKLDKVRLTNKEFEP